MNDNPEQTACDTGGRNVMLHGALWTSPVWVVVLLYAAGTACGPFAEFMSAWDKGFSAIMSIFLVGSSLCLVPGFAFAGGSRGILDASKRAVSSAAMVAFSYLLFAVSAFFFSTDEKGPAWGGAFGLASAAGSCVAALLGAWASLFLKFLGRSILNPYQPEDKPSEPGE